MSFLSVDPAYQIRGIKLAPENEPGQSFNLLKSVFRHYGILKSGIVMAIIFCVMASASLIVFGIVVVAEMLTAQTHIKDYVILGLLALLASCSVMLLLLMGNALLVARRELRDWDERYVGYGFITAFEFASPLDGNPVKNTTLKLKELFPKLQEGIDKGKARLTYDADIQGMSGRHHFDAVIVGAQVNRAWLVRQMSNPQTKPDDLKMLVDEIGDVAAVKKNGYFFSAVVISSSFSNDAVDFANHLENWRLKRGLIHNILLLEYSESRYRVIWSRVLFRQSE